MLSLRQLLTGVSEDSLLAFMLGALDSLGFQATSWQSTSAARIFVQTLARVGSDLTYSLVDIAKGGYGGLAEGPYADMCGQYMFNLLRVQATPVQGVMLLTSSPASPPFTWLAGTLIIADAPKGSPANNWLVVDAATLNPGSQLSVSVVGLTPGAQANIPPNSDTLELWTPLVGVGVSNPPQPPSTPINTWITFPGTSVETDGKGGRYNSRMLGRWDRIGGGTDDAYKAHCFEALPALTRVSVREGTAPNTVHIVGATAVGGLDSGQITTILNYLTGVTDGISRRMINDILEVVSANQVTTPSLGVVIYVDSSFSSDAITRVQTALAAFIGAIDIGGKKVGNSMTGKVLLSALYRVVTEQQGVEDVDFSIAADISLSADDIYAAIPTITMVIV